ncbi:uncharacterized protein EAF02_004025 [Botrytis sinoallii]|uniref:uncharacterized protein n=1 Tax=Botrytis sinoallii TaxID=1463999 RepID=UPI001902991A|nr:uncharacterized protein EAF02_004025 [Botrytis sinoallii]KAF7885516.1 hypothetical protein EAF02_004025 [Botrytis sinoallii]
MSSPGYPKPADGDQDRGGAVIAVYWSIAAVAMLVVGLRFYSRRLVRAIGADDWLMLISLIFQVTLSCFCTYEATIGGFKHLYYLSPSQLTETIKWNYILQCWGISAFTPSKLSVGLLLIRILHPIRGWKFWTIVTIMTLMTIINTLDSILTYAQCNPPKALWEPTVKAHCWNPTVQANFSIFQASFNVFTDTVFALLPATIIWGLQMPKKNKLILCLLLGPGLFAAVAGIVKITYLYSLNAHSDITWVTYNLVMWSGAENFVVLVCGSVPPLKTLYDRYFTTPTGYNFSSTASSGKYYKTGKSSNTKVSQPTDSGSEHELTQIENTGQIEQGIPREW